MTGASQAALCAQPEAVAEFPTTPAQRALWQKFQAIPGDPTLNVAARWRIEGPVDLPMLEQAWSILVDRHEILRSCFVLRGDELVQQVGPSVPFKIRHVDLRGLPADQRDAAAERLGREEAAAQFATLDPPLLRITVLQREDRRADMLLTTHHLALDCWSNLILARELCAICQALHAGQAPALPELPMQFGDYAAWRTAWLAEGGADEDSAYWRQRLAGLGAFSVPVDQLPAAPTRRGDIVGVMVPEATMRSVLAAARLQGATFFAYGLAAFTALLHRWARHDDILVTTQVAGRNEVELESVTGPFINTIALRGDCAGDPRFSDLLDATLGTVGEALQHASLPFEMLERSAAASTPGRRHTLDAVNFQVLNSAFLRDADAGAFALNGFPSLSPGAKRDLDLYLVERSVGWRVQCEFDPDLFEHETVEWLLRSYLGVLEATAARMTQRLSELPFTPRPGAAASLPAAPLTVAPQPTPAVPAESTVARSDPGEAAALLEIWCSVLKRDAVAPDDNFFALGGDSLRAAQLLARAEARFGRRIGLAQLFRAPTPAGMAALFGFAIEVPAAIAAPPVPAAEDTAWQIVPVLTHGSGTPVIGINNIAILHRLSQVEGIDHPITCLRLFEPGRPHGIAGLSMEEIAARYVALVRRAHPKGPYILLGECVHGVLAYEVARQLRAAGETVSLLAALNMWHPDYVNRLSFIQRWRVRALSVKVNFAEVLAGREKFSEFLGHYSLPHRLGLFRAALAVGLIKAIPARTGAPEHADFLLTLMRARDAYVPPPSDGPMVLMTTADQPHGHGFQPSLGWEGTVTGPMALHRVRHARYAPGEEANLPSIEATLAAALAATR
ncbi:MAG: condensation domain-containing protein [Pseudomonadota bacterium]